MIGDDMPFSRDPRPGQFDARWMIHASLTGILGWIALRLWMPDDLFSSNHAYAYMASIAPENTWAAVVWLTACAGVVGATTRSHAVSIFSITIVSTMHGILALLLALPGPGLIPGVLVLNAVQGYYLLARRVHAGL